jgi:ATP-dependent RNA helicase DeaD
MNDNQQENQDSAFERDPINENQPAAVEAAGTPEAAPAAAAPEGTVPATDLPEYTMADLPEGLRVGFEKLGWTSLMPVQAKGIPYILAGRDMMIQSRTGSGKTGAYLVPIFERINPNLNATQALILVPTRELCVQVVHEAENLGAGMNVRTVAVYGGVGYGPQLDAFRQGAHLVVGTPGRILDHLLRRSLNLDQLKVLVFDEADRMMSMGFYPDMKRVQRYLPERLANSYMFSATFPPRVLALSREFLRSPEFLNLSSDHVHVTEVEHVYYNVPAMDKERALIRIIETENPSSAIIFCNRKERVHFVATILERYGYNAAEISSDLAQGAREEVMERIRQGRLRFMVATDVAARGIDIPELSHVFLYEVPEDPESYIHRAGRTGRAGSSGAAISLVNALEKVELKRIGKRFSINFEERPLPSDEDVTNIVSQRTIALLEARLRARDRLQTDRMQRFLPFVHNLESEDETTALEGIAMLLDDFYHEAFHTAQIPQMEEPEGYASTGRQFDRPGGSRGGVHRQRRERPPSGGANFRRAAESENIPTARPTQPATESAAGEPGSASSGARRRRRRGGRGRSRNPGSAGAAES